MRKLFALNTMNKKLLIILMSVAIVSTATVTIAFSTYEISSAKNEQINSLNSISKMLAPNITTALIFQDIDAIDELIKPMLIRRDIVSVIVNDNEGRQVAIASNVKPSRAEEYSLELTSPLLFDSFQYGELIIRTNNSYINDRNRFYTKFSIALILFTFTVSLLLSLLLRRRFLKPILYLAETAQEITKSSNYSLRAKQQSLDEVGQLTDCFNNMLQTIEQRESSLENQVQKRTKELETANDKLYSFAYKDGLTGLPNRRYFYEKISELIKNDIKFTLIFLDLDGFKDVNDSLGHDFGDLLLIEAAERLKTCITEKDLIARLGGDEFTLILEGINDSVYSTKVVSCAKAALNKPMKIKSEDIKISASLGITFYPIDGQNVDEMVKRADQAMYLSKKKGRNRYEFFTYEIEEQAIKKRRLIEEMRIALLEDQFELYYQPILLNDGVNVDKAEALIRWNHPEKGMIPPNYFIPVAEQNGLIAEIGQWVKLQAIRDAVEFQSICDTGIQISINTSPLEIDRAGKWVEEWIQAYKKYNLAPHSILIEVTENTLMDPNSLIQHQLKQLHKAGIDLAIDDFGVGYSSLAYLQRLDIDVLKIDKSFIDGLTSNYNNGDLIKAIITMAHNLDIQVVAEGVETQEQYTRLKDLNCDFMQGYLFSKPICKNEFMAKYINKQIAP
ncbi:EAL domain-containing protein [Glaciecola sp. 2405UD65-10]|uniref:bifunctional diguanylate cyclase/phosphodiesterase n=1 Tax=Glaciecola sp. 2405UD65-10 TaxID=3397244 RepID=UPI003B5B378F